MTGIEYLLNEAEKIEFVETPLIYLLKLIRIILHHYQNILPYMIRLLVNRSHYGLDLEVK